MVDDDLKIKRAVERFFSKGKIDGLEPQDLAAACDRRVRAETQVSAKTSVRLGRKFVRHARSHGGVLYVTALRACGWALLVAGNYPEAEKTYLRARALTARDAMVRARIDRVLIDVYMYLARFREAERRAKLALKTFGRLKAADEAAKTRVNYANLLHRQDRHQEANRLYRQAATHFQSQGNDIATALCWYNQGNTEVQLFDFPKAGRLFTQARKIFEKHGHALHAIGCLYGLAWLHMLEGNFHTALQELSECEAFYRKGRQPREMVLCQLDRAESYLGLNLFLDARSAADTAAAGARKLGIRYEAAKAAFFSGKASLGLGQTRAARASLNKAAGSFRQLKNEAFLAATNLTLAQLHHSEKNSLQKIRAVRRCFQKAQLPLWEAICDLQIITKWPDEQAALRRLAVNKAARTVPHLAARRYTILGDREARRQRLRAAIRHWTKAADILDAVRAKLPPVDMRSSFFRGQSQPHRRLIDAQYEEDPLAAACWSERYKTVGLWSTSEDYFLANPARSRVQKSLSQLAGQVTAVSGMISHPGGKRTASACIPEASAQLHRRVRHDLAALERGGAGPDTSEAIGALIRKASSAHPIVQFHAGTRDLTAFVHHRGGTRAHRFTDAAEVIRVFVARWRFLVECTPKPGQRFRLSDRREEEQLLRRIGTWLLPPLELPSRASRLLLIPEGQLTALPWHALIANQRPLAEDYQLLFSPSIRHYLHARRSGRSRQVKIFVGDTKGLPHVRREVETVRARLAAELTDVHRPCRREDWPDKSSAHIWHFTGHAHLRADNPFYSSLLLADGPLFAADFRLKRNRVTLVTLAACRTGQQTSLPGEEAAGLVRSLLEMGARSVVASGWAVADHSTSVWMDLLYRNYLGGMSAAEAVRQAALGVREKFPSAYHWGAFSVFGAG